MRCLAALAKHGALWFDGSRMKKAAALSLLLVCVLCTGMSRKPKFTISVHLQGASEDNPRMIFREAVGGQQVIFKLVPEFSQSSIAAIHPFPAADGNGSGLAIKLDMRGANALETATRMNPGLLLLSKVNGKTCDVVTIDRPVGDGIFTIWSGVPQEVIEALEKKYPHISRSHSAAEGIEMTPTTKKEKKDAMRRDATDRKKKAKDDADAAAAEEKPRGGFFGLFGRKKAAQSDSVPMPQGPATTQIPIEGARQPDPAQLRLPDPAQPIPLNQPLPQR